ncbi:TIGR03862 family flavoprotein [Pseudomonas sp.]|uniref:TIGR03862 family flavoprotein n=1 Tax=Pseudomonas sp. TaxID=306 RepID=UPI0023532582|nr:TIGR03862 family flavoprotein [Pseudomonas sp.]
MKRVAIVGGGPAGLMAAESLVCGGTQVDVYDAMPSVGRKFLLAGVGGLNLTHAEAFDAFVSRYGARAGLIRPLLEGFPPDALRAWVHGLGIDTFVGSSGRVFPTGMKAAPLLRAWLHRLRKAGVRIHVRHRWAGWDETGALRFTTPTGECVVGADATVLALGGASWPKLGSDGAWVPWLTARGVELAPLQPSNCGFDVAGGWSEHLRAAFAGQPLKTVGLRFADAAGAVRERRGELMLSDTGIEGGLVYALSAPLREAIAARGAVTVELDLLPDRTPARVLAEVSHPRGARSLSSHLQSRTGIKGAKMALLREVLTPDEIKAPATLARAIKSLPLTLAAPRPIAEAISSAGGVRFEALDAQLMLRALPGVFCAGEMLDWDAPTGGYLLTACFASGRAAGQGVLDYLRARSS